MREITNLIDSGLVRVPPSHVLLLEDAALAHQLIATGNVRGKLLLKVAELYDQSPRHNTTTTAACTCGIWLNSSFLLTNHRVLYGLSVHNNLRPWSQCP
jgi:hypothetical protein